MSWFGVFQSGGPVMWPLLLCSLLAVAIIVERAINLRASKILSPTTVERVTGLVEGGRTDRAIEVCRANPGLFTAIVLAGLEIADRGEAIAKEAVEDAGRHETARLTRYLAALGTIAAVAPLLGLLGTVTGMIEIFGVISNTGVGKASELSSGIAEALLTTAAGLLIAIPTLVAYNYFQSKVDSMVTELERDSLRLIRGVYVAPSRASVALAAERHSAAQDRS